MLHRFKMVTEQWSHQNCAMVSYRAVAENYTNPIWLLVRVIPHGGGQPVSSIQAVIFLPISHYVCKSHVELIDEALSRWQYRFHNFYNMNDTEDMRWLTTDRTLIHELTYNWYDMVDTRHEVINNLYDTSWHNTWGDLQLIWHWLIQDMRWLTTDMTRLAQYMRWPTTDDMVDTRHEVT